ncbi:MAG: Uma2 family endonuclease [Limnothrix sp.]
MLLQQELKKMAIAVSKPTTLEDYFALQPEGEARYELENGEWKTIPPESELNRRIAIFLLIYFAQLGISAARLSMKTEIAVFGSKVSVRIPDLIMLSEEAAHALEGATRSTITLDMPLPELVVEVVSPGKENIDRDYRYKRAQYQARAINEYWIIDPITEKITVLTMNEGLYDEAVFEKQDHLSSLFIEQYKPQKKLTVAEVLQVTEKN